MYVYIYALFVCMSTDVSIHTGKILHIHSLVFFRYNEYEVMCMYAYMFMCIDSVCVYVCISICVCACDEDMRVYRNAYMYICICIRIQNGAYMRLMKLFLKYRMVHIYSYKNTEWYIYEYRMVHICGL